MIVDQNMECQGPLRLKRFGNPHFQGNNGKPWDGVHMRGKLSVRHYTNSIIRILSKLSPPMVNMSDNDNHRNWEQAAYTQGQQTKQTKTNYSQNNQSDGYEYQYQRDTHKNRNRNNEWQGGQQQSDWQSYDRNSSDQNFGYNVNVSNMFSHLGN